MFLLGMLGKLSGLSRSADMICVFVFVGLD